MTAIMIRVGDRELPAELNDSPSALAVVAALPLTAAGNVWGDEIYFTIPVALPEEPDAQEEVAVGTLAYWPPGQAFCIFFGPTPASKGREPRAYSPVNRLGRITGDATVLRGVRSGVKVEISRAVSQ
jgi:hypothetical protein